MFLSSQGPSNAHPFANVLWGEAMGTSGLTGRKTVQGRPWPMVIFSLSSLSSSRGHTSFLKAEDPRSWHGFNQKIPTWDPVKVDFPLLWFHLCPRASPFSSLSLGLSIFKIHLFRNWREPPTCLLASYYAEDKIIKKKKKSPCFHKTFSGRR